MKFLYIVLFFTIFPAYAQNPIGWHWYNIPAKEVVKKQTETKVIFASLSPSQQVAVLHFYTINALNKATLHPTEKNIANYVMWQNFWTEKASDFTQNWRKMLLNRPSLDYSIAHPHENNAAKIEATLLNQAQDKAIKKMAQSYGLFFFYEGNSEVSRKLAPIIAQFAKSKNFSLIPISVDGERLEVLPNSKIDSGQARKLGIHFFPVLMLVNPKTKQIKPVNYGFITLDELSYRLLNVATNWKRRY